MPAPATVISDDMPAASWPRSRRPASLQLIGGGGVTGARVVTAAPEKLLGA